MTAWWAARAVPAPPDRFLDLGCGIGTVLLLLAWRFPEARGTGVEAQAISVDLARRSVRWNGADARCRVVHGDLRDAAVLPPDVRVSLVTGTPPYLPSGTATESRRPQVGPCHVEHRGGVEAYCAAAARWLHPDGHFVFCAAAGQHARVDAAARAAGLAVTDRLDVVPRAGKSPLLAVHTLRRQADGPPNVHPPLVVRDRDGVRTAAFRAVRADMGLPP